MNAVDAGQVEGGGCREEAHVGPVGRASLSMISGEGPEIAIHPTTAPGRVRGFPRRRRRHSTSPVLSCGSASCWAGRLYQSLLSPDGAGSSSGGCSSDSGWMSDGRSVAARMVCHAVCLTWSAGELPTRAAHSVHMKWSSRCK